MKKDFPVQVAELRKLGHFIESADGKMYAHASTNRPHGPSYVVVVDSQSGRLIGSGSIAAVIGSLEFTEQGLAYREDDGSPTLLVPIYRGVDSGGKNPAIATSPANNEGDPDRDSANRYQAAADAQTRQGAAATDSNVTAEYSELRERYRGSLLERARFEERYKMKFTAEQRQQPDSVFAATEKAFGNDVAKNLRYSWREFEEAKRLLDTRIKLLTLDLKSAKVNRDAAQSKLRLLQRNLIANSAAALEIPEQKAVIEALEVEVEKAATLVELFSSIENESD